MIEIKSLSENIEKLRAKLENEIVNKNKKLIDTEVIELSNYLNIEINKYEKLKKL